MKTKKFFEFCGRRQNFENKVWYQEVLEYLAQEAWQDANAGFFATETNIADAKNKVLKSWPKQLKNLKVSPEVASYIWEQILMLRVKRNGLFLELHEIPFYAWGRFYRLLNALSKQPQKLEFVEVLEFLGGNFVEYQLGNEEEFRSFANEIMRRALS